MCTHDAVEHSQQDDYSREWPEQKLEGVSWPTVIRRRWTYSYMNRILRKGSRQMLADGTHLSENDLYKAPHDMEASFLLSKFR